jgi:4-amino-4-deoxychorismate lyase
VSAGAPQAPLVWVDGRAADSVPALDRALHYGDGLFETIACVGGTPRLLPWHLERLTQGCDRLGILRPAIADIEAEVRLLARGQERAIIKVLLTRGVSGARGYAVSGTERAKRVTVRYGWPDDDAGASQDGVQVRTATLRLGENPHLAGLKHCNRLEQVLARREWTDPAIAEALLYSRSGRLVCGTMSNVFMVQNSWLRTPRIDLCGVAGVMRRAVLAAARHAGIDHEECVLGADDVAAADELFLTNARIGLWPVAAIDGRALPVGPVTRRLQVSLGQLLEGSLHG